MLTKGDDFPLHQTSEPIAFAGPDRNFYDRYFFNGYSADRSVFFAAAMGFYPQLGVVDASFCVLVDGVQHNVRASRRSGGERLDLSVGPISIGIDAPLERLSLRIAAHDGPVRGELHFTGRHFPIEEPRFIRRTGTRLFMDYTRLTQNGHWTGWVEVAGRHVEVTGFAGTRDRSWGIRPVGAADSQPPAEGALGQFFWIWTPMNFAGQSLFFHSNDDGTGEPWNRRAVLVSDGGSERHFGAPQFAVRWEPGTRRVARADIEIGHGVTLALEPMEPVFAMSGLGYTHPVWGHGRDHGPDAVVAHDAMTAAERRWGDPLVMHVQALTHAVLTDGGTVSEGMGVLEQLFVGPHTPSGLSGLFDPA